MGPNVLFPISLKFPRGLIGVPFDNADGYSSQKSTELRLIDARTSIRVRIAVGVPIVTNYDIRLVSLVLSLFISRRMAFPRSIASASVGKNTRPRYSRPVKT